MTAISDEMLMAYADGELDADDALRVARAIAVDADLAARHQAHQRLRLRMRRAHGSALDEPVPERLLEAVRSAAGADVVDLAAHRAARAMPLPPPVAARAAPAGWARWGGLAASLAVGIVVGAAFDFGSRNEVEFETTPQGLAARGVIADALSTRLAAAGDSGTPVRLQISFIDRAGHHCRTFSTDAIAGLACRSGGQWTVQQLLQMPAVAATEMRPAGNALPAELLEAVERRMQGEAFDAAAEKAALARGWER